MRLARMMTASTKRDVAEATAVLARETERQRAARDALVVRQNALAAARANQRSLLVTVRSQREKDEEDLSAMQAASAAIAAQIRAHQDASGSNGNGTSSSGLTWPVNGLITSGFGWRWGRMHEGIDIGAPSGAAIHAAAGGTVIYCGWMGGYGNLIVIDHGGGLATAYGHQSGLAVGCGTSVGEGQVIGYVGCTGHCFGPHVHFEVRVNGSPVDPLGYL